MWKVIRARAKEPSKTPARDLKSDYSSVAELCVQNTDDEAKKHLFFFVLALCNILCHAFAL